jgi:hypothetical protein
MMNTPILKDFYKKGDTVAVLFMFGDQDMPMILGKIDGSYIVSTKYAMESDLIDI